MSTLDYLFDKAKKDNILQAQLKSLYKNWFEIGSVLYNSMSEIVVICNEQAPDKFEKIDEIKNRALDTLDKAHKIGLTNPDFFSCEKRTGTLAHKIKLAKREKVQC